MGQDLGVAVADVGQHRGPLVEETDILLARFRFGAPLAGESADVVFDDVDPLRQ